MWLVLMWCEWLTSIYVCGVGCGESVVLQVWDAGVAGRHACRMHETPDVEVFDDAVAFADWFAARTAR